MNEKTVDQVPAGCAKLYENGLAILEEGDVSSAIASFTTALDLEPGFFECRRALREAQSKAKAKTGGFWTRISRKGYLSPTLAEAEAVLHLKPLKTISLAERIVNDDPRNVTAHRLLAKAALSADLPRTAVLSLQILAAENSQNRSVQLDLAEALTKSGDKSAAAVIYGQLLKDNPHDRAAARALKNISTQTPAEDPATKPVPAKTEASPVQGREEPAAAPLVDDEIIKRFEPMIAHCSRNTKVLTSLAQAYARKNRFDDSLSAYERVLAITGGKNPSIEQAIADVMLKKLNKELSRIPPSNPEYEAMRERIDNWRLESNWRRMQAPD